MGRIINTSPEGTPPPLLTYYQEEAMESITFEICVAEGDPLDRTLGVLVRSQHVTLLAAATRPMPEVPMGTLLTWIDRMTLAWCQPSLQESSDLWDLWDALVRDVASPF